MELKETACSYNKEKLKLQANFLLIKLIDLKSCSSTHETIWIKFKRDKNL